MNKNLATPKQVAFLTYMGVRDVANLSKEEASQRIDTLLHIDDLGEWERLRARQGDWITDRFILYPDIYASEFQKYLNEELPTLLHTYVRGRVTGAAERLTKPKIREVVHELMRDDRDWWRQAKRRELFFERLRQVYPACCEGREPTKPARPPNTTPRPATSVLEGSDCLEPINSARPLNTTTQLATPVSERSGCLVMLVIPILLFAAYGLIRMLA